jgi:hypothetical protein
VRYSHLSPDFLQEAVDKLVPPTLETTMAASDLRSGHATAGQLSEGGSA